jgi:hypothetical protein
MIIMPLFGNVFYKSARLESLPSKGTGKFSGLADVAASTPGSANRAD